MNFCSCLSCGAGLLAADLLASRFEPCIVLCRSEVNCADFGLSLFLNAARVMALRETAVHGLNVSYSVIQSGIAAQCSSVVHGLSGRTR